jgi:hypothetical protein
MTSSTSYHLPFDLGSLYFMHVPATTWKPPATSASIVPSSFMLSAARHGFALSPPGYVANLVSGGYYASITWY